MNHDEDLPSSARDIRRWVLKMVHAAGSGHIGGPLGMADVLTLLYFDIMNIRPNEPDWSERDIFLLSNGHEAPVQYAAMALRGYFQPEELLTLRKFGSRLQGHPERQSLPGLETTSGPLGCGLSQACGMALAWRMNDPNERRIFVTLGDGELDEGNVWEAAMLASKYGLAKITAIVDRNHIQIDGNTQDVLPLLDVAEKFRAFGWHAIDVNGNDFTSLRRGFAEAAADKSRPSVLVAHTIPGKGVDFMEKDYKWHGKAPNDEELQRALAQLGGDNE